MKCYVIQVGDTDKVMYVKDVPRTIKHGYYGSDIESTQYDDEAKHYKTYKLALGWVQKNLIKFKNQLDEYIKLEEKWLVEHKDLNSNFKTYNPYDRTIETTKLLVSILSNAKVVDVDVDVPSFNKKFKFRYDGYRERGGTAGKGLTQLCVRTDSRYTCKCCGIKLKNIPYYDFYEGNNTKICIPCLYIRQEAIKSAYESMDEGFRTELHNELIIRSL